MSSLHAVTSSVDTRLQLRARHEMTLSSTCGARGGGGGKRGMAAESRAAGDARGMETDSDKMYLRRAEGHLEAALAPVRTC